MIYALKEIKRIVKPGGKLLIADEVRPKGLVKKMINGFIRFPLVILTYIVTQTATRAVEDLPETTKQTGFLIESVRLHAMGSFVEVIAIRPEE